MEKRGDINPKYTPAFPKPECDSSDDSEQLEKQAVERRIADKINRNTRDQNTSIPADK